MAKIGVSGPWIARYRNVNGVISYEGGIKLAMLTQFEAAPDTSSNDNNFYADNALRETARNSSRSGTITESVDDFTQEGSKMILGVQERTITVNGEERKYLAFNDSANPGYFGHGIVIKKRKNNVDLWRAVVHRKIMFDVPGDAATTQGETIEWQAEELTGTYMPDDSPSHDWKSDATFSDEVTAVAFVESILNIQSLGALTVTSEAGEDVGFTTITISPALISGHTYKFIVAVAVGLPSFDQVIGEGYTDWDGTSDIQAAAGQQILVVEVDAESKAKKGGIATIIVNGG